MDNKKNKHTYFMRIHVNHNNILLTLAFYLSKAFMNVHKWSHHSILKPLEGVSMTAESADIETCCASHDWRVQHVSMELLLNYYNGNSSQEFQGSTFEAQNN